MPNLINQAIAAEYDATFTEEALDTLFLQPVGMEVEDVNLFRAKLGEAKLRMRLVKSSLVRRTLEARGLSEFGDIFAGPAAVVVAEEEGVDGVAITAAKVVEAWRKETGNDLPAVKGGLMEGGVLDADAATGLAKLPGKPELMSRISGQIIGPAATVVGQIVAPARNIAGAVKSHIDKLEGEG